MSDIIQSTYYSIKLNVTSQPYYGGIVDWGIKRIWAERLGSPIKMPPDKLLNLGFVYGMKVLELMHGWELFNIQSIRGHHICTENGVNTKKRIY